MTPALRGGLLAALALVLLPMAAGAELRVTAELDRTEARLGEAVTLTLTVPEAGDGIVAWPDLGESLGSLTVLGQQEGVPPETILEVRLTAYQPGEVEVPALEVALIDPGGSRAEGRTRTLTIRFALSSEPGGTPAVEQLAPAGQMETHRTLWRWWVALGALAAAGLLAWGLSTWMRRRRARRGGPPPPPPRPAHEVALEELRRLERDGLLERGELRLFFIRLVEIIKAYAGARFGFYALESTTEEVRQELQRRGVDAEIRREVETLLDLGDLVKFAEHRPGPGEVGECLPRAHRIVALGRPPLLADDTPAGGAP